MYDPVARRKLRPLLADTQSSSGEVETDLSHFLRWELALAAAGRGRRWRDRRWMLLVSVFGQVVAALLIMCASAGVCVQAFNDERTWLLQMAATIGFLSVGWLLLNGLRMPALSRLLNCWDTHTRQLRRYMLLQSRIEIHPDDDDDDGDADSHDLLINHSDDDDNSDDVDGEAQAVNRHRYHHKQEEQQLPVTYSP